MGHCWYYFYFFVVVSVVVSVDLLLGCYYCFLLTAVIFVLFLVEVSSALNVSEGIQMSWALSPIGLGVAFLFPMNKLVKFF